MRRRLLLSYLALAAVILILLEVPLAVLYARRERDALAAAAKSDATALAVLAGESLEHPREHDLQDLASRYHHQTGAEVAITDSAGHIIVGLEPAEHEGTGPDIGDEITAAIGGRVTTRRHSDRDGPEALAALPVRSGHTLVGSVVVAVPGSPVEGRIHRAWVALAAFAGGLIMLATVIGLWLARSLTRPLLAVGAAAGRLGHGELSARAPVQGPPEVGALATSFNVMADRLAEVVGAERRFVADASHQLRTPLTALRLRLENAAARFPATAVDLDAAQGEVERLTRLIDGLLTLTRARDHRGDRIPVDLPLVVRERCSAWAALADEQRVELSTSIPPCPDLVVSAIPGHIEQILDNLLANAVEASPPRAAITVAVEHDAAAIAVRIRDRGPGLTADQRRRAFDRFWQADGQATGTSGLGLAIARQLAQVNQADIDLRSPPGGGLEAVVMLRPASPPGSAPKITLVGANASAEMSEPVLAAEEEIEGAGHDDDEGG